MKSSHTKTALGQFHTILFGLVYYKLLVITMFERIEKKKNTEWVVNTGLFCVYQYVFTAIKVGRKVLRIQTYLNDFGCGGSRTKEVSKKSPSSHTIMLVTHEKNKKHHCCLSPFCSCRYHF